MQRRWQLDLLWHLLVACTLLTWNTTWAFEDKFYQMVSGAVPPSFVSCRLSKVCLNPTFMNSTPGWLQFPSLCVGQISNPNMASNISLDWWRIVYLTHHAGTCEVLSRLMRNYKQPLNKAVFIVWFVHWSLHVHWKLRLVFSAN
jgi:hypothetical protein